VEEKRRGCGNAHLDTTSDAVTIVSFQSPFRGTAPALTRDAVPVVVRRTVSGRLAG
jgi:hypothetical protein